jgi:ribosomal-protein-alanine N-acetyltransferase
MTNPFPVIQTKRLLLRQFNDQDLENVFRGLSHPQVIEYYGVRYDTLEAAQDQMNFFSELEENETGIWWAVCSPDNKEFFGAAGLNNLIKEHKKAEIGFWLLPEYWGKGFITEALPKVCQYGFNNLKLHRIEALVETENFLSKNVLIKQGFSLEGTLKGYEVKNGRFISVEVYAKFED